MKLSHHIINYGEVGLVWERGQLVRVLDAGSHWLFSIRQARVEVHSQRDTFINTIDLDQLSRSPLLAGRAQFVNLTETERALVWVDGRLAGVLGAGLYGVWLAPRAVEIERFQTGAIRFQHTRLEAILRQSSANTQLETVEVPEGKVGALFLNGALTEVLAAGRYAFWRHAARIKVQLVETREQTLDLSGQEILTQDKVTLRLNAVAAYQVVDVRRALETVADASQALYREAQLLLRQEVGARSLDALLADKAELAAQVAQALATKAEAFGLKLHSFGVRDIILPGEMKTVLNQVIEAQKAAEANVIRRREETAAMRSQLNTAKLMAENPVLMRLRELEALEVVAKTTNLHVVAGEEGLALRLAKLV